MFEKVMNTQCMTLGDMFGIWSRQGFRRSRVLMHEDNWKQLLKCQELLREESGPMGRLKPGRLKRVEV